MPGGQSVLPVVLYTDRWPHQTRCMTSEQVESISLQTNSGTPKVSSGSPKERHSEPNESSVSLCTKK